MKNKLLQSLAIGSVLAVMGLGGAAMIAPAHADPYNSRDRYLRDHPRQAERIKREKWERRAEWRRDHRYWNRHDRRYDYYPPAVVYEPAPPPGISFVFRSD